MDDSLYLHKSIDVITYSCPILMSVKGAAEMYPWFGGHWLRAMYCLHRQYTVPLQLHQTKSIFRWLNFKKGVTPLLTDYHTGTKPVAVTWLNWYGSSRVVPVMAIRRHARSFKNISCNWIATDQWNTTMQFSWNSIYSVQGRLGLYAIFSGYIFIIKDFCR